MAQTDRYTGSALVVSFPTTATLLETDYRSLEVTENVEAKDATAGSDAARFYKPGKKDASISLSLVDRGGTAGTALWAALVPGTNGTLTWGEEGTATGKPKHTVVCFVQQRKKSEPYDDIVEITIDFQPTAAVTDTAY